MILEDAGFNASIRFLLWTSAFAAAIVVAHFRHHTTALEMKVRLAGAVMVKTGLAVHQCYYWIQWRHSTDVKIQTALESVRHITGLALAAMVIGCVLIMQPFFRQYAGAWWWAAGLACIITLWAIGYGDATWRA